MSKLPSLVPNLLKDLSPAVEIDPTETKLRSLRETVMQDATESLETLKEEVDLVQQDDGSRQLTNELNEVRFRVARKEKLLELLTVQSEEMKNEQETVISAETINSATSRSMERSYKGSVAEFDQFYLYEKKQSLDKDMEAILNHIEAEDFYTEQMSALLLRSQEAMLRSRAKTDQLRYLQKRLLKRHEEISTLQTRASNEFIHTAHSVTKTSESFAKDNHKRSDKMLEKRSELDTIRKEVEGMSESLARHMLKEQESDLHSKRVKEELSRLTKVHNEVRLMENANRDSISKAREAMDKIKA